MSCQELTFSLLKQNETEVSSRVKLFLGATKDGGYDYDPRDQKRKTTIIISAEKIFIHPLLGTFEVNNDTIIIQDSMTRYHQHLHIMGFCSLDSLEKSIPAPGPFNC